jgi:hypothetical protein
MVTSYSIVDSGDVLLFVGSEGNKISLCFLVVGFVCVVSCSASYVGLSVCVVLA